MSDMERLIQVIRAISKILAEYGHADFAGRLDAQTLILVDAASSSDAIREARERLHASVNGMGGLNDLWLAAGSHSGSIKASEELDELTDELYELTK